MELAELHGGIKCAIEPAVIPARAQACLAFLNHCRRLTAKGRQAKAGAGGKARRGGDGAPRGGGGAEEGGRGAHWRIVPGEPEISDRP